jgi:hypothetical protein
MVSDGGGKLDVPKQWFKVNVDTIMKIYGAQHQIQREELFLGRCCYGFPYGLDP